MFYLERFHILTRQADPGSDAGHICIAWFLAEANGERDLDVGEMTWLFFESHSRLDSRFFVVFAAGLFLAFAVVVGLICLVGIVSLLGLCPLAYKGISGFDNGGK